jgi:transcription elongation factor Elf1
MGQHMRHDVVVGGPFEQVISWRDRGRTQVPGKGKAEGKAGLRTTYTCPHCGLNAWVKADVVVRCGACEVALESEGA